MPPSPSREASLGKLSPLVVLLLASWSCGTGSGAANTHSGLANSPAASRRMPTHGPAAHLPSATPVRMRKTPALGFELCRSNPLLRPGCPRRLPAWNSRDARRLSYCMPRNSQKTARETIRLFPSNNCVLAQWGYEGGSGLPRKVATGTSSNGDSRTAVAPPLGLLTPPLHVHFEVAAASEGLPPTAVGFANTWPQGAHRLTDALLSPSRRNAVSLGWVRWYGHYGQLVLAPVGPQGGEWSGHLIFYIPPDAKGVSYALTLHAWLPAPRLMQGRSKRSVRRFNIGAALSHVAATLRSILASASLPRPE